MGSAVIRAEAGDPEAIAWLELRREYLRRGERFVWQPGDLVVVKEATADIEETTINDTVEQEES